MCMRSLYKTENFTVHGVSVSSVLSTHPDLGFACIVQTLFQFPMAVMVAHNKQTLVVSISKDNAVNAAETTTVSSRVATTIGMLMANHCTKQLMKRQQQKSSGTT